MSYVVSSRPTVYWDTCLFFALVGDEDREDPTEMAGLYSVALEIESNRINMVTSAMMLGELNRAAWPRELQEKYDRFTDRSNVDVVPFAPHMGDKAAELRDYYRKQPGPNLCRDDAYHLATAITLEVDAFHTFDERDKKGCRGLIPLSGSVAGYPLRIMKPVTEQGTLGL